jgi:phage terminase Nu1 subunit (DNA packaging protein)
MECDPHHLDLMARRGHAKRAPVVGYFELWPTIQGELDRLREEAAGRRGQNGADVAAESAALKRAQRERIEREEAVKRGDLIEASKAIEAWGAMVADARTAVLSIPARIQGELPHMVASEVEKIKAVVRGVLRELAGLDNPPKPS